MLLFEYVLAIILFASLGFLYWLMIRLYQKSKDIDEKNAFLDELLRNSGISMYKTKNIDHQMFYYFKKEATPVDRTRQNKIESSLWKAVNHNEFDLHYQPQINLIDNKIVGVEALLRWNNPVIGDVDPAEFIPLVEETGLISLIGEWTFFAACRTNMLWQQRGLHPIYVSINISPKQFAYQNIAELIATALKETRLKPHYVEIEITENVVMEDIELAVKRLNEIKRLGVKISIDDFGTGYTSLKYLKYLPIDKIKIDQSFISGIPDNKNDAAIVSAIIALAHQLELQVVVEGVETATQLQFLQEHHCDIAQGYYFNKPLNENEIIELLKKQSI